MASIKTYIFFGLNAARVLSIVSIFVMVNDIEAVNSYQSASQSNNTASVDLASCDYIENSTVPNQLGGVFWAIVNRLLIIFQVVILIMSEVGWPMPLFDRFFPVLGSNFGLGPLGIFQGFMGAAVLSQHVDDFTFVAAFFLFVVACLNMLLGLIFRESAKERRSIHKDVLPSHLPSAANLNRSGTCTSAESYTSTTVCDEKRDMSEFGAARGRTGYGFGRQGFLISKPLETLPRYAARPTSAPSASSRSSTPQPHFNSSDTAI
ncbi:hypothetical protein BKA83DRAFT_4162354 [Pisolithus microcarpus]|nr:hypothetical protein BKA83DRAFT_4162354 [Pisolithus microcarpus]